MALPDITRDIDDIFTHSWYEIRAEAIDNILDANVVTAALRDRGCFTSQTGGLFITRTIRYGQKTATNIKKGDTLSHGEDAIETMARWTWKYTEAHAQRSLMDDQKNSGPHRIKSLVKTKLSAARDALDRKWETNLFAAVNTGGSAAEISACRLERDPNSLYNILPTSTYHDSGHHLGFITLDNTWWRANYKTANDPSVINLLPDMVNLYNTCGKNKSYPNLIVTAQDLFEVYENTALDAAQIVKNTGNRLADLGFDVLKFKGKDMVWTGDMTAYTMFMLNTEFIEIVYDPNLWFDMTGWKYIALQTERIAHIICATETICTRPSRQGFLGTYTS